MKSTSFIFAAIILVSLSSCSDSRSVGRDTAGVEKPFDISGVSLGMELPRIQDQLKQQGFEVRTWGTQRSWHDVVDEAAGRGGHAARPKMDAPQYVTAIKAGERIDVELRPSANGGEAWGLSYTAAAVGRSVEDMQAGLIKRYGSPSIPSNSASYWCSIAEPSCAAQARRKDFLTASTSQGLTIKIFPGLERQEQYVQALNAAARVAAGVNSHASF